MQSTGTDAVGYGGKGRACFVACRIGALNFLKPGDWDRI